MKKNVIFFGAIIGAVLAITYYLWGASYCYSIIRIPLFSRANAWLVSLLILGGMICYALYYASNYTDNLELSSDKVKALNHPPSRYYLSNKPNGFTIGKHGRRFVRIPFLNSPEHQLIIGAPGDFKSTCIESAIIYNFNFADPEEKLLSMLVVDVKPELSRRGVYEGRDDVYIINPSITDSCGFDVYYALNEKSSDDDLYSRFSMVANTIIKDTGDNEYFADSARNIFTAFLMYGFIVGMTFGECIDEILDAPVGDLIAQILEDDRMDEHKRVKRLVREFDGKTSDGFQDVAMTLKKDLAIFDNMSVKACFAANHPNKVSPIDLANGKSIFLAIPDHLLVQYSPVFRLILNMCMDYLMSQDESQKTNKRPIWVLIDEFGSIGKLPVLNDVLARGRSKGIQCSLVIQSEGQLDAAYGHDMTRAIKDCCKNTIVFGSNDIPTCEGLSKRTGMYIEAKTSTTTRGNKLSGDYSRNESTEYRPAVDVADIQNLSKHGKVLIFAKGDWFICNKMPYFKIRMLHDKSIEIEQMNEARRYRLSSES